MLDVPTSTLRRWARQFEPFLSSGARKRKRIYNDHDLTIFAQVRDLAAQNYNMDDIAGRLGRIVDLLPQEGSDTKAMTLPGLLNRLDDFEARQAESDARYKALQDKVLEIERQMQKPWWKRLLGG